MHLLSFRLLGHPALGNIPWISVGGGLTLLKTRDSGQAQALFGMLQTVNPPYDLPAVQPFQALPLRHLDQRGSAPIVAAKKTAALALFSASPKLVRILAKMDPLFYETDRIEIGRRRDYHRWVHFVELSTSTRWSEVEPSIRHLTNALSPAAADIALRMHAAMFGLNGTDRIKGDKAVQLANCLQSMRSALPASKQVLLDQCLEAVDRARLFRMAKEITSRYLPLFFVYPTHVAGATTEFSPPLQAVSFVPGQATLTFLARELELKLPDASMRAHRLQQLNDQLRAASPDWWICWQYQQGALSLQPVGQSERVLSGEFEPVAHLESILWALAGLHGLLYDNQPIFLLNLHDLPLSSPVFAEMFRALHRILARHQVLAAVDEAFFAFCNSTLEAEERTNLSAVTLIDLARELIPVLT